MTVFATSMATPWRDLYFPLSYLLAFALMAMTPVLFESAGEEMRKKRVRLYFRAGLAHLLAGSIMGGYAWFLGAENLRLLGHYLEARDIAYVLNYGLTFCLQGWMMLGGVLTAALLGLLVRPGGRWMALSLALLSLPFLLLAGGARHSSIQFQTDQEIHISGMERAMPVYEVLSPILMRGAPVAVMLVVIVAVLRGARSLRWLADAPEERRTGLALAGLVSLAWGVAAVLGDWCLHLDRIFCKLVEGGPLPAWRPVLLLPACAVAAGLWAVGAAHAEVRRTESGGTAEGGPGTGIVPTA